jgi:hypothetical protein
VDRDRSYVLTERGLLGRSSRDSATRPEFLLGALVHATRCGLESRAPSKVSVGAALIDDRRVLSAGNRVVARLSKSAIRFH